MSLFYVYMIHFIGVSHIVWTFLCFGGIKLVKVTIILILEGDSTRRKKAPLSYPPSKMFKIW